jgi:hypothetical protein
MGERGDCHEESNDFRWIELHSMFADLLFLYCKYKYGVTQNSEQLNNSVCSGVAHSLSASSCDMLFERGGML